MPHHPNFTAELTHRAAVEMAARDAGFGPSKFASTGQSAGNIRAMLEAVGSGTRLLVPGLDDHEIDLSAALDIAVHLIDICVWLTHQYPQHAEQWSAIDQVYRLRDAWCQLVIRHDAERDILAAWQGIDEPGKEQAIAEVRANLARVREIVAGGLNVYL